MRKKMALLLAVALVAGLLFGCGDTPEVTEPAVTAPPATEPAPTAPPDGNPGDVTCKGSYTGTPEMGNTVAKAGGGALTNEQLQAWYWTAVASYQSKGQGDMPDFSMPLDIQPCTIDDSVNSWQQYFLRQALNNWHTAQALYTRSREEELPVEDTFAPVENYRNENMVDIPATKFLYREEKTFRPNTMHQAYLDAVPEMLDAIAKEKGYADGAALAKTAFGTTEQGLADMVSLYNYAYMFQTNQSYFLQVTEEEIGEWFDANENEYMALDITRESGHYVTVRQILLVPEETDFYPDLTVEVAEDGTVTCPEELWVECEKRAQELTYKWNKSGRPGSESVFADYASKYSKDAGTAADGGAYRWIEQGQLIGELDQWCFAEERKAKDFTVIRTAYGIHMLYFVEKTEIWEARSERDVTIQKQRQLILETRDAYPMTVDYEAITLSQGETAVDMDRLLYEDLAHERFPEIPLYLQQDYPGVMYGAYKLRTHGCGITSLAMLASYMTDEEWTPPELCALYGRYNTEHGTDVSLFMYEPAAMGFYNRLLYHTDDAMEALENGHIVISSQQEGYWTRGGHYIVVEKLNEDGTVQVRDSNVFNYGKLEGHKQDKHTWKDVTRDSRVMFAFDKKLTRVNACSRCGDCQGVTDSLLRTSYLCHKCRPALLRRDTYLSVMG